MEKVITIFGKIYLRNGVVVEEKIVLEDDEYCNKDEVVDYYANIQDGIEKIFKTNEMFTFTFGKTVFRGSDISAIRFEIVEGE